MVSRGTVLLSKYYYDGLNRLKREDNHTAGRTYVWDYDVGGNIQCTETHPFQVKDKGWVDACDLVPGDIVYTKDWNTATVRSVNLLELPEPVEVFNFEVEDYHTYFVGRPIVMHRHLLGENYFYNPDSSCQGYFLY